jgi:hypothetical protein
MPPGQLIASVKKAGRIRVIIGARDDHWIPEGLLSSGQVSAQRQRVKTKVTDVVIDTGVDRGHAFFDNPSRVVDD